jgi:hypothetical protein
MLALARPCTTSPSPPTFAHGASSGAKCTTCMGDVSCSMWATPGGDTSLSWTVGSRGAFSQNRSPRFGQCTASSRSSNAYSWFCSFSCLPEELKADGFAAFSGLRGAFEALLEAAAGASLRLLASLILLTWERSFLFSASRALMRPSRSLMFTSSSPVEDPFTFGPAEQGKTFPLEY